MPARPGGFRTDFGKQGCCVAGKAMALLDLILALHKCRRYQAAAADEECYAGALPDLLADARGCCATKNYVNNDPAADPAAAAAAAAADDDGSGGGGGDYAEEDEECAAILAGLLSELTAAAAPRSPYARCIAQCSTPPRPPPHDHRCRAHRAPPCKAAVRVLVVAFEGIATAARTLFARERPPDMTVDARNLVTLCADLAANDDVDTDRCLGRIKGVLKHSHGQIKYLW